MIAFLILSMKKLLTKILWPYTVIRTMMGKIQNLVKALHFFLLAYI